VAGDPDEEEKTIFEEEEITVSHEVPMALRVRPGPDCAFRGRVLAQRFFGPPPHR
jgi:hypothetical protein